MSERTLTKAEWEALGRVFESEIQPGSIPVFQSKRKIYSALAEDGCVERVTIHLRPDRLGSMSVTGWMLTERGRILYCDACERFAPEECAEAEDAWAAEKIARSDAEGGESIPFELYAAKRARAEPHK